MFTSRNINTGTRIGRFAARFLTASHRIPALCAEAVVPSGLVLNVGMNVAPILSQRASSLKAASNFIEANFNPEIGKAMTTWEISHGA